MVEDLRIPQKIGPVEVQGPIIRDRKAVYMGLDDRAERVVLNVERQITQHFSANTKLRSNVMTVDF